MQKKNSLNRVEIAEADVRSAKLNAVAERIKYDGGLSSSLKKRARADAAATTGLTSVPKEIMTNREAAQNNNVTGARNPKTLPPKQNIPRTLEAAKDSNVALPPTAQIQTQPRKALQPLKFIVVSNEKHQALQARQN